MNNYQTMSMPDRGFSLPLQNYHACQQIFKTRFFIEANSQLTEHHDLSPSDVKQVHTAVDKI